MVVDSHKSIVLLNDNVNELNNFKSLLSKAVQRPKQYLVDHKLDLIDENRMILTTGTTNIKDLTAKSVSRHYHFDFIDFASKCSLKTKLLQIVEELLVEHQPCCLVRFGALRECQSGLLSNILVTQMEKRIRQLNKHILSITIEHITIQKYNAESLLTEAYDKRNSIPRIHFPTTLALLNWLQGDYCRLWQAGDGHECVDFEFHLADAQNSSKVIKFSVIQFYFELMDHDTTECMYNYFLNMGSKKRTKNCLLTSCLKNYFDSKCPWSVWLLFDILVENNGTCYTEDILNFAYLAHTTLTGLNPRPTSPKSTATTKSSESKTKSNTRKDKQKNNTLRNTRTNQKKIKTNHNASTTDNDVATNMQTLPKFKLKMGSQNLNKLSFLHNLGVRKPSPKLSSRNKLRMALHSISNLPYAPKLVVT